MSGGHHLSLQWHYCFSSGKEKVKWYLHLISSVKNFLYQNIFIHSHYLLDSWGIGICDFRLMPYHDLKIFSQAHLNFLVFLHLPLSVPLLQLDYPFYYSCCGDCIYSYCWTSDMPFLQMGMMNPFTFLNLQPSKVPFKSNIFWKALWYLITRSPYKT